MKETLFLGRDILVWSIFIDDVREEQVMCCPFSPVHSPKLKCYFLFQAVSFKQCFASCHSCIWISAGHNEMRIQF